MTVLMTKKVGQLWLYPSVIFQRYFSQSDFTSSLNIGKYRRVTNERKSQHEVSEQLQSSLPSLCNSIGGMNIIPPQDVPSCIYTNHQVISLKSRSLLPRRPEYSRQKEKQTQPDITKGHSPSETVKTSLSIFEDKSLYYVSWCFGDGSGEHCLTHWSKIIAFYSRNFHTHQTIQ